MDEQFLERLFLKLRCASDAIRRALDQLEADEPRRKDWRYVRAQCEYADGKLNEIFEISHDVEKR